MSLVVWNFVLALVWAATTEAFTAGNFAVGMVIGFVLLFGLRRVIDSGAYFRDLWQIVVLIAFFLWELVLSNLRMAWYTIMPLDRMRPGIVAVPLEEMSEVELLVLTNLITITPGTLTLDLSEDRRTLYVHAMDAADPDAVRRDIKKGFERKVLDALRSEP
ncbi:MAG: Na+/H+ antiporter subunit E [Phycisphaerales bacterium]|jgi:multicomponent Na+:H+ antiporter subunit E